MAWEVATLIGLAPLKRSGAQMLCSLVRHLRANDQGVVDEVKRIRCQVRFGACAILANRDALIGIMRVFEVMAEECFRVTVFARLKCNA